MHGIWAALQVNPGIIFGSVAQSVGDFSMILGAVKLFDGFAEVTGIRPQRGASSGSKATPLLV